jgi:hypothetical protein
MIAEARSVNEDLAAWCQSQVRQQLSATSSSPEVGYDVLWPGYRASIICFLDVLSSIEEGRFGEDKRVIASA